MGIARCLAASSLALLVGCGPSLGGGRDEVFRVDGEGNTLRVRVVHVHKWYEYRVKSGRTDTSHYSTNPRTVTIDLGTGIYRIEHGEIPGGMCHAKVPSTFRTDATISREQRVYSSDSPAKGDYGAYFTGAPEHEELVVVDPETGREIKRMPAPSIKWLQFVTPEALIAQLGNDMHVFRWKDGTFERVPLEEDVVGMTVLRDTSMVRLSSSHYEWLVDVTTMAKTMINLVEPTGCTVVAGGGLWMADSRGLHRYDLTTLKEQLVRSPVLDAKLMATDSRHQWLVFLPNVPDESRETRALFLYDPKTTRSRLVEFDTTEPH